MRNFTTLAIATVLAGAVLAIPGQAQEIVVEPRQSALERFVDDVSSELSEKLGRVGIDWLRISGGIAKVRFETDANGEPINVRFYEKSRDRNVNRAALKVVNRLDPIDLAAIGYPSDTTIHANIVIAKGQEQADMLLERLEREESIRIAANDPRDRKVLALVARR